MASGAVGRVVFRTFLSPHQCSASLLCRLQPQSSREPVLAWGHQLCRYSSANKQIRQVKRMEKLGVGPDGKPLPLPNNKRVFPRMYKTLVVNQDGSTYYINHRHPYRILTMPLDLTTLSRQELERRRKAELAAMAKVYVEEEGLEDEQWDQNEYKDL